MEKKKVIIIGAGITGLSAGCYALMNGFDVEIYESHSIAGGMCTGWKRKDFTFEGCIHWLTGSNNKSPFYKYWNEVGAFKNIEFVNYEIFKKVMNNKGGEFNLYSDVDKLEKHMIEISPEDKKYSKLLCNAIRKISKMEMNIDKAKELQTFKDKLIQIFKVLPYGSVFAKLGKYSAKEFAANYKNELIREVIGNFPDPDASILNLVFVMSDCNKKTTGYPIGGSLKLVNSIEENFKSLGGKIYYKSNVKKIVSNNGYARSIILDNGSTKDGDYIISAGDLYNTIYNLLEGNYLIPEHTNLFKDQQIHSTIVQVNLGVDYDFSNEDQYLTWEFDASKKIKIGDEYQTKLHCRNFVKDNSLAPKGKTVIQIDYLTSSFKYWEDLYRDKDKYKTVKNEILENSINELELKFPGIKDKIEVSDVVTPYTYYRYTQSYEGKFMSWIMEKDNQDKINNIPKTIKGLENLYFAGQWVEAVGGLPVALKSGRDVVQLLCKKEKKKFVTI